PFLPKLDWRPLFEARRSVFRKPRRSRPLTDSCTEPVKVGWVRLQPHKAWLLGNSGNVGGPSLASDLFSHNRLHAQDQLYGPPVLHAEALTLFLFRLQLLPCSNNAQDFSLGFQPII